LGFYFHFTAGPLTLPLKKNIVLLSPVSFVNMPELNKPGFKGTLLQAEID